jgi:hypothetical protein
MALIEAIQKVDDGNFLRALAKTVLQIIMDADAEMLAGAANCLVAERCWDRARWAIKVYPLRPNLTDGGSRGCRLRV